MPHGRFELCDDRRVEAPADTYSHVRAREMAAIERAHVVERDRPQARDGAFAQVRVGRAAKHQVVQRRLAELLVGRVAQRVLDRVDRVAAHALEVVFVERRLQERVGIELEKRREVVAVHAARQRRPLDVDTHAVARRERVQSREDLVERTRLGRRVGEHLAGQEGEALLAGRVVLRPHGKLDGQRDRRVGGNVQQYHGSVLGFGCGGQRRTVGCAAGAEGGERDDGDALRMVHCRDLSTPTVRRSLCK